MDIATLRDWIIVIVGIVDLIVVVILLIIVIAVYNEIMKLIARIKQVTRQMEKVVGSPLYKAIAWIFGQGKQESK